MQAMNISQMTQCLILYPMRTRRQFTQKFSRFQRKLLMKIYNQLQLYNQLKRLSLTRCVCKKILLQMSSSSNSRSRALSLRTNQHFQEKKAIQDCPCLITLTNHHKCQSAVLSMLTLMLIAITHPLTKMFFSLTSSNWFLLIAQMPPALLSKVMIPSLQFVNKNQSLKVNQT